MVELQPREYRAVCTVIGPELLDDLAGESDCTQTFWARLDACLRPPERQQLHEHLTPHAP